MPQPAERRHAYCPQCQRDTPWIYVHWAVPPYWLCLVCGIRVPPWWSCGSWSGRSAGQTD